MEWVIAVSATGSEDGFVMLRETFEETKNLKLVEGGFASAGQAARHIRKLQRETTRFTLGELLELLARGSPIGLKESDALVLLERAFREGPLGQKFGDELLLTEARGPSPERILALLEGESPIGPEESAFLDAVRRLGYHR